MTMDMAWAQAPVAKGVAEEFSWDAPVNPMVQQSIAAYGSDEDRMILASHFSVSTASLETMALVPSPEVKFAILQNPMTPPRALELLTHDPDRFIRSAAKSALAGRQVRARSAG